MRHCVVRVKSRRNSKPNFLLILLELKQLLPLGKEKLTEWDQYSMYIAAFITSHRGYSTILQELLKTKFNLKRKLPSGRHPLLVAVRRGHIKCVEVIRKLKFRLIVPCEIEKFSTFENP